MQVVVPGAIAYNDQVAFEWFAPAGLNRGGIDVAIQAERKLTHANRDDMYESNLMRRLSGLLYLDNKVVGDIKEKIKKIVK